MDQIDNFKHSEDMDVSKISRDSKAETHGVVELDLQQQLDQYIDNRIIKMVDKSKELQPSPSTKDLLHQKLGLFQSEYSQNGEASISRTLVEEEQSYTERVYHNRSNMISPASSPKNQQKEQASNRFKYATTHLKKNVIEQSTKNAAA